MFAWRANKLYCSRACKDKARDKDLLRASSKAWLKRNPGKASAAKAAYRKRVGRGDRSGEYRNKRIRSVLARTPSVDHALCAIADHGCGRYAHVPALVAGIVRIVDRADRKARARADRGKAPGTLSAYTLALKANPEAYARALTRWRAKTFKRKTGRVMLNDGTASAAVILGGDRCLYCNVRLNDANRSHDHMIPLTLGGVHSAANIAPCCIRCNTAKGPADFNSWIVGLAGKDKARALSFFEKKNGSVMQIGLGLSIR